ncbi:MAG: hypothetical protein HY878_00675 [Deltaproteobacteria bacterium]|nr:hypothetical protein [Deltaproteobacteria bacterium]
MVELIKSVRLGVLIGLLGLILGINWAFWLVLGHDRIHESLEKRRAGLIQPLKTGDVQAIKKEEGPADKHEDPIIELSHRRLLRGHLHLMGLGLVTIVLSLTLTFTSAPDKIKTIASILTGLGGLIYPLAWIVMGYRTPSLGPEGAEASVVTIAGPGVAFVSLGILTAIVFLLRDVFAKR